MIISVDFDGTIVEHRFPEIGPPVPGAIEFLKRFQANGAKLILWTMRSDQPERKHLTEAVEYCKSQGLEFWGINRNPEQDEWTSSLNPYGHKYIDDAAVGCPLIYPVGERPYVNWTDVGVNVLKQLMR